jgi:hypothetical protein
VSHSITAPMKVPAACTKKLECCMMYICRKPHISICTAGQYIRSNSRGHDERSRYQWRSTIAPTRRGENAI